ncbi:MAG: hypothetical protein H6585_00810 [Flavobacteriales bacterium]|nr:hypothetical protein [Flavobacteriales bacterium]MCB9446866.1 hypothetical protein [Flavobacteriales bacterium]
MAVSSTNSERTGLLVTLGIHGLLLLLFLLWGLHYMVPPPPEIVLEVDFGTTEDGFGNVEETPATQEKTQPKEVTEAATTSPQPEAQPEEVQTQTTPSPVTQTKTTPKPTPKPVEKEPDPQPSTALQKALEKARNQQKNGGSEGETTGTGNQGDPEGTDSNEKDGPPGDFVNGHYRKVVSKILPETDCPIGASIELIVMEIIVNQDGTVIRANPVLSKSTTTDPCLVKRAREAALKSKWNADYSAPPQQKGQFKYRFEPS